MMITKILPDLSHAVAPSYTHTNFIGQRNRAPPELIIEIENSKQHYLFTSSRTLHHVVFGARCEINISHLAVKCRFSNMENTEHTRE